MKTVFNIVKTLRPHFFSLRELEENVSLDIKIPTKWRYEEMELTDKDVPFVIKVQDKKQTNTLISLISPATEEGYTQVFNYASTVIKTNMEEEEKERLFNEKVQELKTLFLSSSLDKLKEISFNEQQELSVTKGDGEVQLRDSKGSGADGDDKEETNI